MLVTEYMPALRAAASVHDRSFTLMKFSEAQLDSAVLLRALCWWCTLLVGALCCCVLFVDGALCWWCRLFVGWCTLLLRAVC